MRDGGESAAVMIEAELCDDRGERAGGTEYGWMLNCRLVNIWTWQHDRGRGVVDMNLPLSDG